MPIRTKTMMVPKIDNQTMHPAKHLRQYIKMNETKIAKPKAASNNCQFYINNYLHFLCLK